MPTPANIKRGAVRRCWAITTPGTFPKPTGASARNAGGRVRIASKPHPAHRKPALVRAFFAPCFAVNQAGPCPAGNPSNLPGRAPWAVGRGPRAAGRVPGTRHPSRWKLNPGPWAVVPGSWPVKVNPGRWPPVGGNWPRADGIAKGPRAIGSSAADRGPWPIFQRSRPAGY